MIPWSFDDLIGFPRKKRFVDPHFPFCDQGIGTNLISGLKQDNVIENQFFFMRDWHFGATLSLVMMVLMLVSSFIFRKYQDDDSGGMLW